MVIELGVPNQPTHLKLGDAVDSVNLYTCGILITGGLAGGEIYPWATQTTEVL